MEDVEMYVAKVEEDRTFHTLAGSPIPTDWKVTYRDTFHRGYELEITMTRERMLQALSHGTGMMTMAIMEGQ